MQIAVIGSWDTDLASSITRMAGDVGAQIARRGDVLFTGGSTGVMEAAMKGAKQQGGITVGILPTTSAENYPYLGDAIDISVHTGMGELGKMAPLIHSAAGVIAIAGGSGTLIEISMAYIEKKPIVLLPVPGFTSERLRWFLTNNAIDHRHYHRIDIAETPEAAVTLLYERLGPANS
ncbi:MAG: TIGR00725 family protein [Thermodesulfobacteriota bacterium]